MKFILNAIKRYADKILEMLSDFSKIFQSINYSFENFYFIIEIQFYTS